ncbi:MAG: hypothetical protein HKM98_10240, partial [Gammaproteobacteria bacterium]|nr:hypothetical protein [Gammaproteobacteria bacterium]
LEQIEIADQLASTYYEMGNIKDANRENRFTFRVNVNEFGNDSAELVPAINKLAGWYEKIGEFTLARDYYKKSIELIENEYGEDDLRLVSQLQKVAGTYRGQHQLRGEGRDALVRAVDIFESHPEADVVARALTLTDLGDWLMVTSRRNDAIGIYKQAWNMLTGDGASPDKGKTVFGRPKRLRFIPPIPTAQELTGANEVYVDVAFAVTPEGGVTDLEVQDATAHWRLQNDVRMAMRGARYRPKFSNGEPVPAKMNFRWTYRVPNHLRRPQAAAPETAEPTQSDGSATKNSRN